MRIERPYLDIKILSIANTFIVFGVLYLNLIKEVVYINRINIIYGHFGSGKTEFSINYALYLKKFYEKVAIVDLDIINMYFRIREKREFLEQKGIDVYYSSLRDSDNLDIPALDPNIVYPIKNKDYHVIIDCGGDPKGALVLNRYKDILKDTNNIFVINRHRDQTSTKDKALSYIKEIELYSGQKVSEIVNNTHMLKDTSLDDVLYGYQLAKDLAKERNINLKYNVCKKDIYDKMVNDLNIASEIREKLFPIDLIFRENWML